MIASRIAIILMFGIIVATLFTQKAMSRVSFFKRIMVLQYHRKLTTFISDYIRSSRQGKKRIDERKE